ncbi:MAG: hypothetical protein AAF655_11970 [Bacteroidota bacterium]
MLKRLPSNIFPWFFWGVVILLHLLFFFLQKNQQNYWLVDSHEYVKEAFNLLDYGVLYCGDLDGTIRYDFFTKRPPMYPLVLAVVTQLLGSETTVVGLQMILSLLNVFLMLRILETLGLTYRYSLSLLFLLLYPAQFMYAQWIMTEILFQSCLLVMVGAIIFWQERKSQVWIWIYLGALLLGLFTKPVLYLFIFPSAVVLFLFGWKKWRISLICAIMIPFLAVGMYMYWNAERTGYFHFSSIQNLSLLQYTTFHTIRASQGGEAAETTITFIQETAAQKESFEAEQLYIQEQAVHEIGKVPLTYLGLHLKGMLNFFLDPGRFDLYNFMGWENQEEGGWQATFSEEGYAGLWKRFSRLPAGRIGLLVAILLGNLLKLIGLGLFLFNGSVPRVYKWILVGMILYISGLTGISGASRFAVPVFPILLICASLGWSILIDRWKYRKLPLT